ncbi:RNA polymerase sigma factor [Rhodoplanes sp. TEM]|uniref:RNA polymerase sigma factor n=1 Tax=Rhodoplanes tepidamans TaxID=200616 RepID=A0ABT5J5S2_RHOTP|nr:MULTISPECIES: RNA polymerase sigma factor [Rhodoplanes]MDC7784863.1 RNA polymerase sigma factor [Rhodoplanes tepidamans]MDC7986049.1 RNA polymerase sigma factor [Rhodoplanes sp. TEM]MDQ0353910.1 RNA polymerase sigma-70 factor (ECF subfamily) [Rhodoplanes tepidamans]
MSEASTSPLLAAVVAHYDELTAYVQRKVGCPAAAADIMQETCLRLVLSAGAAVDNPRAYLYRVAGNLATDHLRSGRVRDRTLVVGPVPDTVADSRADAERVLLARQRLAVIARAVEELPPRCRQVFVMRRFDDLDQGEIATRLGISRNMVEKHLRHALAHCARRLAQAD